MTITQPGHTLRLLWTSKSAGGVGRGVAYTLGQVSYCGSASRTCHDATCQVMEFGSAGADRGLLKEFEAIIAVVIGGALLTGGYGSVIGAALGALIFGVVQQGLFFAGVESSLFRVFLGLILLMAVILNTYIRRLITGER